MFITGLEEGLFPHENSMSDRDGLEEERRLMYVAITRARKRLYLSHSQTRMLHGQTRYNLKQPLLRRAAGGSLKWITPKQPALGAATGGSGRLAGQDSRGAPGQRFGAGPPVLQPGLVTRAGVRRRPQGPGPRAPSPTAAPTQAPA